MLLFDVGFNSGSFTKVFRGVYPQTKVVGVEGNYKYVQMYSSNPTQNVEVLNYIVTDREGVCPFFICNSNLGISSINEDWMKSIRHAHFFDDSTTKVYVQSVTLDSLIKRYGKPDFIKLDIEGSELSALMGLSRKSGTVIFEWSEEWFEDCLKCVERLYNLGYAEFAFDVFTEGGPFWEYNSKPTYKTRTIFEKDFRNILDPQRKKLWGMVYAR